MALTEPMVPHHKFPKKEKKEEKKKEKEKKEEWLYTNTTYLLVKQNVLNYILKKNFNTRNEDHIGRKEVKKR